MGFVFGKLAVSSRNLGERIIHSRINPANSVTVHCSWISKRPLVRWNPIVISPWVTPTASIRSSYQVRSRLSLEEGGFESLVPLATEMLVELARGITNGIRMLAIDEIGPMPRLC